MTLYALVDEARNWQAVLIARVYARMVSERPIKVNEAREFCQQMIIAVRSMSPSAVKDQYEIVYQSLLNSLSGQNFNAPARFIFDCNSENIIGKSHNLSLEILNRKIKMPASERTEQWLEDLLYDRSWWEESDRFFFKDSLLVQGHGLYGIYFFPAVRLALIVAGLTSRSTDPAARIMRERRETHKLLSDHEYLLDQNDLTNFDPETLRYAFEDFDKAAQKSPGDERVENLRGGGILCLNKIAEAEVALQKSLELHASAGRFRAGTLYDLACVYARQDRAEDCRQTLLESAKLKPLDKKYWRKMPT